MPVWVLLIVCGFILAASVLLQAFGSPNDLKRFFSMALWQGLLATFVGAFLALLTALWVYRRQQHSELAASRQRDRDETLRLLDGIVDEIKANHDLLAPIAHSIAGGGLLTCSHRMSTTFIEGSLVRLLQLSGEVGVLRQLGALLSSYEALNWTLEGFRAAFGAGPNRVTLNDRLRAAIPTLIAEIKQNTKAVLSAVEDWRRSP